jgi:hypothetical protein
MRNILQSKLSEDHASDIKLKEKNTIMYNELVRVAQETDKAK